MALSSLDTGGLVAAASSTLLMASASTLMGSADFTIAAEGVGSVVKELLRVCSTIGLSGAVPDAGVRLVVAVA